MLNGDLKGIEEDSDTQKDIPAPSEDYGFDWAVDKQFCRSDRFDIEYALAAVSAIIHVNVGSFFVIIKNLSAC